MQRQIQEIQALATKYSKADLGRMVQLGLLDPQKAMMAGMMIQRIEQQNAKPPQSTVAQEVLGMPTLASGPMNPEPTLRKPPQLGAPPAPPLMMAAEGGLTTIPADNVGEYAGGGIVAFADGGEADVPGFAAGIPPGLFEALVEAESRGKHSAVSNKGARGVAQLMPGTMRDPGYGIKPVRDDSEAENRRVGQEYLSAMLRKYKGNIDNALAAYNWGPGNVDKHLKKYGELTPEKLPKETRTYIPKVKNFMAQQEPRRSEPVRVAERPPVDDMSGGIPAGQLMPVQDRVGMPALLRRPLERVTRLLPSAEAAGLEELPAGMQARAEYAGGGILGYKDRGLVGSRTDPRIFEDPLQERIARDKVQIFDIAPFIAGPTSPTPGAEIAKAERTGQYGAYNTPEDQFPLQSYQDMLARRQQGVGYTENGKIVSPDAPPPPPPAGETKPVVPEFKLNVPERARIERPELDLPGTKIDASYYEGPTVPELSEIGKEKADYLKSQGVDPEMYANMIKTVEDKKSKLAARKGESQGEALMRVGLGLIGSRQGKEFEDLREHGTAALGQYKQDVKDLRAAEEKLDDRADALRVADQQAKQTGALADIARRNQLSDAYEAAQQNKSRAMNEVALGEANLSMTAAQIATAHKDKIYSVDVQAGTEERRLDVETQKAQEDLRLRARQLEISGTYYAGILKNADARNKALGAAAQARFMAIKQKIQEGMKGTPEYQIILKDLKGQYGDKWATVPEAQTKLRRFEQGYMASQLDSLGELSSDIPNASALIDQ